MPDALEFAQWQGEQRAAASQRRLVAMAQLRQEAARKREQEARNQQFATELMFKAQEGERDRAAAMERTVAAGTLDIEQEEARAKAALDRMEIQEKSRLFKKLELAAGSRLPGETDEQYFTRANQLLAKQADTIFSRVTDLRKRSIGVAQREATERTQKINRMARDTVIPTLSKSEQAEISRNPVAFLRVIQTNPAAATQYQSTVQRLEESIPPITPEAAIELGGLDDQAKRLDKVGSDLIGDPDFRGAMQYFGMSTATGELERDQFRGREGAVQPAPSDAGIGTGPVYGPPAELAPPRLPLQGLIPKAGRAFGGAVGELVRGVPEFVGGLVSPVANLLAEPANAAYHALIDPTAPALPPAALPPPEFGIPWSRNRQFLPGTNSPPVTFNRRGEVITRGGVMPAEFTF